MRVDIACHMMSTLIIYKCAYRAYMCECMCLHSLCIYIYVYIHDVIRVDMIRHPMDTYV